MKSYRFEIREEINWALGFWTLYGFSLLSLVGIGTILERPIISWVACAMVTLTILIIHIDLVGHRIKERKVGVK